MEFTTKARRRTERGKFSIVDLFYVSADISKKGETTGRTRIRYSAEKAYDLMFDLVSHMERYAVDNEKIGNNI